MSVINRMLQELEERREDVHTRALPAVVRAVPPPALRVRRRPWGWLVGIVALLVLIAALAIWSLAGSRPQPVPPHSAAPLSAAPALPATGPGAAQPAGPAATVETPAQGSVDGPVDPPPALKPSEQLIAPPAPSMQSMPSVAKPAASTLAAKPDATGPAPAASSASSNVPGAAPVSSKPTLIKQMSDEQRADFRYREALALNNQGRRAEARAALEDVLRIDPRHANARQVLLAMHVEARHFDDAERLLREALQLNLRPAQHAMALARIRLERGDAAGAAATLSEHQTQAGEHADYHGFHAAVLQQLGRHREAAAQFERALSIQPGNANWWLALGISLQAEQRNGEAENAYQRALTSSGLSPALRALAAERLQQVRAAR